MLQPKKIEISNQPSIELHIKQWLKYRQAVLVHYSQLSAINLIKPKTLDLFCQQLMDYLSFGHFKMFEKLAAYRRSPSAG